MARSKTLAVAFATVALAMTACGPPPGPAGQVVGRDRAYQAATKQWTYKLTIRKPDGSRHTFLVLPSDYRDCHYGLAYPVCTQD